MFSVSFFFPPCPKVLLFKWGERVKQKKNKKNPKWKSHANGPPPKKPTWGSLSCSLFPSNPHSTFFRKRCHLFWILGELGNISLSVIEWELTWEHPVLPLFHNPYVLSSVSSRAVFCLVGVRRAVPGCSLKMIRILFAYEPWLVDNGGGDLADAVPCPHRHA